MESKKRVLFVDDEPLLLQGMKRMLYPHSAEWECVFESSGMAALARLKAERFDVVVSDMRMPQMDGIAVLTEVRKLYPQTARIILSGNSSEERILQTVGVAQQFISKPCTAEALMKTLTCGCLLRDLLAEPRLVTLVGTLSNLPSDPRRYRDLLQELQTPAPNLTRVGEIVASDIAMTAKVLQLVNSEFFGVALRCVDPARPCDISESR